MNGSRVRFLEGTLSVLGYRMAYKALMLVVKEMCKEKGYTRHNGTHYYFHLVDVAQKLLNAGIREEEIITAALLHDLVEDVPQFTIEDVATLFNENVAHMVKLVTKEPGINYKTNTDALLLYLDNISEHYGASLIKCSDRLHNMGTLLDATLEKRYQQAIETEIYFLPFFKKCRKLHPWYASFFFEAKTTVDSQIQLIKDNYQEIQKLKQEIVLLKQQCENKRIQ